MVFLTDIKNGQEEEVSPDLENLLGRKPASLRDGLKALSKLWDCTILLVTHDDLIVQEDDRLIGATTAVLSRT